MTHQQISDEVGEFLIKSYAQGNSFETIADEANAKFSTTLSRQSVSKFLKETRGTVLKVIKEKGNFEQKLAETYFNTLIQVNELNNDMKELFNKMKAQGFVTDKEVSCPGCKMRFNVRVMATTDVVKVADHLLKEVEHVDKVLGRLKNQSLNITMDVTDINDKIQILLPKLLQRLEQTGSIKVLRRGILKE